MKKTIWAFALAVLGLINIVAFNNCSGNLTSIRRSENSLGNTVKEFQENIYLTYPSIEGVSLLTEYRYEILGDSIVIEDDIRLGGIEEVFPQDYVSYAMVHSDALSQTIEDSDVANFLSNSARVWPNGRVPYSVNSDEFSDENLLQIQSSIAAFNDLMLENAIAISFEEDATALNALSIGLHSGGDSCGLSHVGMAGGSQELRIKAECLGVDSKLHHLMMHTLGFSHQHMRPDRNQFFSLSELAIADKNFGIFEPDPVSEVGSYDLSSLMHMGFSSDFLLQPNVEDPGGRDELSSQDIQSLMDAYAFSGGQPPGPQIAAEPSEIPFFRASDVQTNQFRLSWGESRSSLGTVTYEIFVNGELTTTQAERGYTLTGLSSDTSYSLAVRGRILDTEQTPLLSPQFDITVRTSKETGGENNDGAPTSVSDLRVDVYSSTTAEIFWTPATSTVGIQRYNVVFENKSSGVRLSLMTNGRSSFYNQFAPGTEYRAMVRAMDFQGQEGPVAMVEFRTNDDGGGNDNEPAMPRPNVGPDGHYYYNDGGSERTFIVINSKYCENGNGGKSPNRLYTDLIDGVDFAKLQSLEMFTGLPCM